MDYEESISEEYREKVRVRVLAALRNPFVRETGLSAEDIWYLLLHTGKRKYDISRDGDVHGEKFLNEMVKAELLEKEDGIYLQKPDSPAW